jgi:hypothetical protein
MPSARTELHLKYKKYIHYISTELKGENKAEETSIVKNVSFYD